MMTALAQSYLERKVTDPELRAKLTPDYPVGCKRPLMSREWFPTLTRPNVGVVTEPIAEITEAGIRTADGEVHEVDTIVYGTGFRANEYLTAVDFYGRDGRRLRDDWRDGAEAYLGLTVAGLPEPVHALRPEHQRRELDHLHPRGAGELHHERAAHDDASPHRLARRPPPGDGRTTTVASRPRWTARCGPPGCHNYFRTDAGKVVTQLPYSGGPLLAAHAVLPELGRTGNVVRLRPSRASGGGPRVAISSTIDSGSSRPGSSGRGWWNTTSVNPIAAYRPTKSSNAPVLASGRSSVLPTMKMRRIVSGSRPIAAHASSSRRDCSRTAARSRPPRTAPCATGRRT